MVEYIRRQLVALVGYLLRWVFAAPVGAFLFSFLTVDNRQNYDYGKFYNCACDYAADKWVYVHFITPFALKSIQLGD